MSSSNSRPVTKLGLAVLLTSALAGCHGGGAVTAPTTTSSTPLPFPSAPTAGSLSGVITEMTSTGRRPVEGLSFSQLSCPRVNCVGGISVHHNVTTATDGTYRITGLYTGEANYIWIGIEDGYVFAGARPVLDCEGCDLIVTVNDDTRLDIHVVRR